VTCSVTNSPIVLVDSDITRWIACTGWTATGSAPLSGDTTSTGPFYIGEDTAVTWHWALNALLMTNQTVSGTETFKALDTITAGNRYRIDGSGRVTFRAGRTIRLIPPFRAETGCVFRAVAEP
jgi:hypothetical protein